MSSSHDAERLAALERAVADLQRDMRELRAGLAGRDTARPVPADAAAAMPGVAPSATATAPAAPPYVPRYLRPSLGARMAAYARVQAAGLGLPGAADAERPDVEALVGRYGTVAVAALLILTGVGAFLTWAVNTFTVTPAARVTMGVILAAALAAGGWRLRTSAGTSAPAHVGGPNPETAAAGRDGTRRFGDVLLALALAVTHVNAWAAGPYLALVPSAAELASAALASAALAALAWRGRQQALFVVGVGGALVAPFVTNSATGHPLPLAGYGWLVLSAGLLALPHDAVVVRRWRLAARLLAVGAAAYTVALLRDVVDGQSALRAMGGPAGSAHRLVPALFPLACAAVPLVRTWRWSARSAAERGSPWAVYGGVALAYTAVAASALLTLAFAGDREDYSLVALAFAATGAVHASIAALQHADTLAPEPRVYLVGTVLRATSTTTALVLPLALLAAALVALHDIVGGRGAAVAALWAAVAAVAAWRWLRDATDHASATTAASARRQLGSAQVAGAGLASAIAIVLLLPGHDVARVTLLAAHAGVAAQLFGRVRRPLVLLAPAVVACVAVAWGAVLLTGRPAYAYPPFLTPESLAAGAVTAAWSAIAWRVWHNGHAVFSRADRRLVAAAAGAIALLWGRQELAQAVSPDVSTFLLIGYFAVTGIGAIALGRARTVPAARQIGLALALYAALKAFLQASALDAVGLRVSSYLLVGGFLLAVGYWYRAAGTGPMRAPVPPPAVPPEGAPDAA